MASQEFQRIRWLTRETGRVPGESRSGGILLGIGDDAAVWAPPRGHAAVLTVDCQVEGIHFRRGWLSPAEVGARAVSASASDLAAMAARPAGILLAITLPRDAREASFRALYRGALAEARRLGLAVLGGNLSAGPLQVSVTAIGEVSPGEAVARAGARPGDGIYVTGWPGRASIGLAGLCSAGRGRGRLRSAAAACRRAFASPRARIREALDIARRLRPRSMVDLSDGLALDLEHVLERSAGRGRPPGAVIVRGRILALLEEGGVADLARERGIDPAEAALEGGEDYELLFTAPPGPAERAAGRFRRRFGIPLTRVGTIVREGGIQILDETGTPRRVQPRGFDHFEGG